MFTPITRNIRINHAKIASHGTPGTLAIESAQGMVLLNAEVTRQAGSIAATMTSG